jgi:two-component system, NtrC family, response regulator AtoC
MRRATILVVADDDERLRDTLGILVRSLGHEAAAAGDIAGAERVLAERAVDLVVSDLSMPGGSGVDLLEVVRRADPNTPVIVLTAHGTVETAVEAMKTGAFDYLVKPFDAGEMEQRIARALAFRRFQVENNYLREEVETPGDPDELIGVSDAMRRVFDLVQQVAPTRASVLISGETGTGKSWSRGRSTAGAHGRPISSFR